MPTITHKKLNHYRKMEAVFTKQTNYNYYRVLDKKVAKYKFWAIFFGILAGIMFIITLLTLYYV